MPKTKTKKHNLTIIDQIPEVNNFVYRGISDEARLQIEKDFHECKPTFRFAYDEGYAHLKFANVHSMVFSDYMSVEDEEDAQNAREDD